MSCCESLQELKTSLLNRLKYKIVAMFPGVLERLGASGERLGSVLERPGSVLGSLGAVLVAFKVVLDVKMSSESAPNPKTLKNLRFLNVFGGLDAIWRPCCAMLAHLGANYALRNSIFALRNSIFAERNSKFAVQNSKFCSPELKICSPELKILQSGTQYLQSGTQYLHSGTQ